MDQQFSRLSRQDGGSCGCILPPWLDIAIVVKPGSLCNGLNSRPARRAIRGRDVQCSIARSTLEQYFWVPTDAIGARLLKAYADGHKRITAAAERKIPKAPNKPVKLNDTDFNY